MRDVSIIGLVAVGAIALGVFLFFFGPSPIRSEVNQALISSTNSNGPVSFTVLAQGQHAISITERTNYRIQNTSDLNALWALVYGSSDTPNAPSVDFSRYEVLAVFDGPDPTAGYSISVASVTDEAGKRLVLVSHISPDSTCKPQNEGTSPFQIVEVLKTTLSISHQDQMGTAPCP
jgi:hypothetical protein